MMDNNVPCLLIGNSFCHFKRKGDTEVQECNEAAFSIQAGESIEMKTNVVYESTAKQRVNNDYENP